MSAYVRSGLHSDLLVAPPGFVPLSGGGWRCGIGVYLIACFLVSACNGRLLIAGFMTRSCRHLVGRSCDEPVELLH